MRVALLLILQITCIVTNATANSSLFLNETNLSNFTLPAPLLTQNEKDMYGFVKEYISKSVVPGLTEILLRFARKFIVPAAEKQIQTDSNVTAMNNTLHSEIGYLKNTTETMHSKIEYIKNTTKTMHSKIGYLKNTNETIKGKMEIIHEEFKKKIDDKFDYLEELVKKMCSNT